MAASRLLVGAAGQGSACFMAITSAGRWWRHSQLGGAGGRGGRGNCSGVLRLLLGPVVWVMLGEMFNNKIRGWTGSGRAAQWVANFIVSTPSRVANVGLGSLGFTRCCFPRVVFVISTSRQGQGLRKCLTRRRALTGPGWPASDRTSAGGTTMGWSWVDIAARKCAAVVDEDGAMMTRCGGHAGERRAVNDAIADCVELRERHEVTPSDGRRASFGGPSTVLFTEILWRAEHRRE